jgi:hexokinase
MNLEALNDPDNRQERAFQWLDSHGVVSFSDLAIVLSYRNAIQELEHWNFRDSLIRPRTDTDLLVPSTRAALWVQGGSKERFGVYEAIDPKTLHLLSGNFKHPALIPNEQLRSVRSMYDHLATSTKHYYEPAFQENIVDVIGAVYSNDGSSVIFPYGVDFRPTQAAKGLDIRGLTKILVGNELISALSRSGIKIDNTRYRVIVNDVINLLGSISNSRISLVLGTGLNIGVVGRVNGNGLSCLNSEMCNFSCFQLSDPEQEVNQKENPGKHLAEMIAGGRSMGQVLHTTLTHLAREGILPFQVNAPMDASHISAILNNHPDAFSDILIGFDLEDKVSWSIMREIASRQVQRAAVVVAVSLAAMVSHFPESFQDKDIIHCPWEGSTFKYVPGLRKTVKRLFETLTSRRIELDEIQNADGAAFFVLREFADRYRQAYLL